MSMVIVTGLSPNTEKHCRIPFGAYAQIQVDNVQSNSAMISRTVGAISLGPTGNIQGTYKFMSLLTGRLIKARLFTPLPMPEEVIKQVEEMTTNIYLPEQDQAYTQMDRTTAYGEYQPPNEEDDVSLGSSEYIKISQNELNDIATEGRLENEEDMEAIIPEAVLSHHNITNEVPQAQEPDYKSDGDDNNNKLLDIEGVEDNDSNHEIGIPEHNNEFDDSFDNNSNTYDSEEQEDTSEQVANDEHQRIHYVTKRGRSVKMRKDLFDNYDFLQEKSEDVSNSEDFSNSDKVKSLSTQWSLKQGLKFYPEETKRATIAELTQLHNMKVFQPIYCSSMTRQEVISTLNTLTFIKRKRCGRVKARTCADGRPQRILFQKWESSSPTVRTESVITTSVVDAYEQRTIGVYDIPQAFLHAEQTDLTYIKMAGEAADFLIEVSPETYTSYVLTEKGRSILCLVLKKALYGCVKSALLFWEDLSGKLIKRGYILNPYDQCVANKFINGTQMTIIWHADDLKMSHLSEEILDNEVKWLESVYGPLVGAKGNHHTYLGIDMLFTNQKLQVSMVGYLHEIVEEFPYEIVGKVTTPAAPHLFDKDKNAVALNSNNAKVFHQIVAKVLWASIRVRPDLLTALSYLTCQIKAPDQDDMKKLIRMIAYIRNTIDLPLTIGMNDSKEIRWWVDASFGKQYELRSQTGATLSFGIGSVYSMAKKQKLNTTSSTEAEIVGVHDAMSQVIWFRYFILAQGVTMSRNILVPDNKSAIILHQNGTASSSQNTRHINIRYFFLKDRIKAGEIEIIHCPSEEMIADFFTKPIQGKRFTELRSLIMGENVEQG